MSRLMWRMAGALVGALVGMGMLFWALERTSLIALADGGNAETARAPLSVYAAMFAGLVVLSVAVFFAVGQWSRFLGDNPTTSQLPWWWAVAILVAAFACLLAGIAVHAAWLFDQDPVPTVVNDGFILFEVFMGALVLIPLVLVGVRWAPGYRRELVEA